jgi:hypothetical protein
MNNIDRLAVITALAQRSNNLGRTALMKYCYFLQVLRGVPLGYRFSLYSYGPFDSEVLADLDTAESVEGVRSSVVYFPGGYGYKIETGARAERLMEAGGEVLRAHQADLNWLQQEFGSASPGDLELGSTLVYSDREAEDRGEILILAQLAKRVNELKPRYQLSKIEDLARRLRDRGFLNSIRETEMHAG